MPSPTTLPPDARARSSPLSIYRWLIVVLGIFILLLVLYTATDAGSKVPPSALPRISVIPPFSLTERSGRPITNRDLSGKVWVADFVYTTCPGPCPAVTTEMAKVQEATAHDPNVQLVTFTVDPQTDTPAVLSKYADSYHADPNRWWFLTGPEKPLYDLIQKGFLQAVQDNRNEPPEPGQFTVTHSTSFALVDSQGNMRGVYNSVGGTERDQLLHDIRVLEGEAGL